MADAVAMNKEDCRDHRGSLLQQLQKAEDMINSRLSFHDEQIAMQNKLLERLIALQDVAAKQTETSEARLRMLEKQQVGLQIEVNTVQKALLEREKRESESERRKQQAIKEQPIWKEKWFGPAILILLIIFAGIIGVAIGQNLLSHLPAQ